MNAYYVLDTLLMEIWQLKNKTKQKLIRSLFSWRRQGKVSKEINISYRIDALKKMK